MKSLKSLPFRNIISIKIYFYISTLFIGKCYIFGLSNLTFCCIIQRRPKILCCGIFFIYTRHCISPHRSASLWRANGISESRIRFERNCFILQFQIKFLYWNTHADIWLTRQPKSLHSGQKFRRKMASLFYTVKIYYGKQLVSWY